MTMIGMGIFGIIQAGRAGRWNIQKLDRLILEKLERKMPVPEIENQFNGFRNK